MKDRIEIKVPQASKWAIREVIKTIAALATFL